MSMSRVYGGRPRRGNMSTLRDRIFGQLKVSNKFTSDNGGAIGEIYKERVGLGGLFCRNQFSVFCRSLLTTKTRGSYKQV